MPAQTDSQALPYQIGGDLRCDAADPASDGFTKGVWRQFVEQFEAKLGPLALTAARLRDVPMAIVEWTAPDPLVGVTIDVLQTQWGETAIHWSTVTVDTDDMVNLDLDPSHVTPNRPGVYHVWGMLRYLQQFDLASPYSLNLTGGAGNNTVGVDFWLSRSYTATNIWFNSEPVTTYNPTDMTGSKLGYWNPDELLASMIEGFELTMSGDSDMRVSFAQMGVIWHSELQG